MGFGGFFWLHIKKSAGTTTRSLLKPYYVEVDRERRPPCFIQSRPDEYNDILNNYRTVLGDYQFRRALFARRFLYPDTWDRLLSFAFSREPVDRCLSMFYYLYWVRAGTLAGVRSALRLSLRSGRMHWNTRYAFDVFLDCVAAAQASDSMYEPLGDVFSTHTALMWDDIVDEQGNILLKRIFRLEDLDAGIDQVFAECGLPARTRSASSVMNRNEERAGYVPTGAQRRQIETLYAKDFDLYERHAIRPVS